MLKTFIINPVRENPKSAVLVALIGFSVGVVWSVNAAWGSFPSTWAIILYGEVGAACTLISWVFFSALFAWVFKRSANSIRQIEAIAHLSLLFYSLTGLNVVLHIRFLGYYMAVTALLLFVAVKIAETIFFGLPKKISVYASITFLLIASVLISIHFKRSAVGKNEFWRDREAIPFEAEPPSFSGSGATRVFVNTAGQWRPATRIKSPGVYQLKKKLDNPSRLSLGFLTVFPNTDGKAVIILTRANEEIYRTNIGWKGSGWKDINIEPVIPAGDVEVRVVPQSGEMWISDPIWTWGFNRPNVILIVIDTLRADHLSCYGYPRQTSPTIDKIAKSGILFEHHYSASSWSTAAVASIFTGLYPRQHGCIDFGTLFLPFELETFAEALQQGGYRTVGISGNPLLSIKTGFAQGFDHFDEHCFDRVGRRSGECMTESGIGAVGEAGPTLLYMQYMDPHMPYTPPPPYLMSWRGWPYTSGPGRFIQFITNRYDDAISYCDGQVGQLLDTLRKKGFLQNAIVIITADHGEELGDHGGFNHGLSVFEEVTHLPLIITGTGIEQGVRVNSLTGETDIFPTLIHLAGLETRPVPGKSLLPVSSLPAREWVISDNAAQTALRTSRYKLIIDAANRGQMLYDVNNDPFDSEDVSAGEPALTSEAKQDLEEILAELNRVKPPASRSRAVLMELQKRLRALGYVK